MSEINGKLLAMAPWNILSVSGRLVRVEVSLIIRNLNEKKNGQMDPLLFHPFIQTNGCFTYRYV
jgi:hypothetical protein